MANSNEITEYQEGNRIAMTYAHLTLLAGSIFVSTSFAIFGLSFNISNPPLEALVLMSFASGMLYWVFLMYNERYTRITHKIIYPRLQCYEKEKMEMKFHSRIKEDDDQRKEKCWFNYTVRRIRFWNYFEGIKATFSFAS